MGRAKMKAAFLLPVAAVADVPLTMSWADWKNEFGMTFNGEEDTTREQVFNANVEFIATENAKGNTYTLGVNQFSHLSLEEFQAQFTGAKGGSVLGSDDAHLGELEVQSDIATSVDWSTDRSVVNPVKDQGQCGSCWAFFCSGNSRKRLRTCSRQVGKLCRTAIGGLQHQRWIPRLQRRLQPVRHFLHWPDWNCR